MSAKRFLKVPTFVLVGENDVLKGKNFNQEAELMTQQGENRVERCRRWLNTMKSKAEVQGCNTEFKFQTLPHSGHSFGQCMTEGNMEKAVFEFLFETHE